ncbi:MAG: zinc ribbon domain-containing protein [Candidatus Nitrosopelagicus sp.]
MRSLINDVEELIALGAGDKYRLNDIRERLERGKKLFISDLEYLEKLVKTHLGRRLSPEPRKPKRVIRQVEESEPSQPQTESGKKSRKEELKENEKKYLDSADEGFTINEDGEIGEKTSRKTEKSNQDSAFGMCVKCGSAISAEDLFCTSCGAKR